MKFNFGQSEVNFLRHLIDKDGISLLPEQVSAILNLPQPTSVRQVRRFIGVINYYRRFLPNCSTMLTPLTCLLKSKTKNEQLKLEAFKQGKTALANFTKLNYVKDSKDTKLTLITDASDIVVGTVIHQLVSNTTTPISFFSAKMQYFFKRTSNLLCN